MKYKNRILVFSLIFILTFSFAVSAGPEDKIRDMNFKDAEIVDVLRTIAEAADVNLITDSSVSGTTTVHLKDITFQKALDLITQTRELTYEWDDNTIVVAPPERIDTIYGNIVTEFVSVSSNNLENIGVIIKDIFPDTQITEDALRRQFILKGEEERVNEIKEMIKRLDTTGRTGRTEDGTADGDQESQVVEEDLYTESFSVVNAELDDLEEKLKKVNFNLDINTNSLTDTITISGREKDVKEALSMLETYDESLEPETRTMRVDYVDAEQISEIIEKFYPDIKLHVNQKRKEIILNGAKNKLDGVVDFVKEINVPREQVVLEIRVEEITTDFLKEIGITDSSELSTIEFFTKDGMLDDAELTWPQFFEALNDESETKTLARPSLMTLNGEEASMEILDEDSYEVVERNEDGSTTETYDYAEAGVSLEFTPWITENQEVELNISPEVSSFTEIQGDEAKPPDKRSRKVETTLRLKNNETFAIGGLIQTDNEGAITKIPILGDIPIIGEIFKRRESSDTRNELVIFVTPRIIKHGDEVSNKNIIKLDDNDEEAEETKEEVETKEAEESKEEVETENAEVVTEDTEAEETQEETVEEESGKTKEEILEEYKNKDKEDKGFQGLTEEELQEILNK